MNTRLPIRFSHSHHQLSVKGCEAGLDVLAFEGSPVKLQPDPLFLTPAQV
jgi:hypothetical protein